MLFTDVVSSTEEAVRRGDAAWSATLAAHQDAIRHALASAGGTEIDMPGDGAFATFDGPARAIRCAQAIIDSAAPLGLHVRAGVHVGEVERTVAGIAVHAGARIAAEAAPDEVWVSAIVTDLVAGSGLAFDDRGEHELKGLPAPLRLSRVLGDRELSLA